jgi:hypothetical protein
VWQDGSTSCATLAAASCGSGGCKGALRSAREPPNCRARAEPQAAAVGGCKVRAAPLSAPAAVHLRPAHARCSRYVAGRAAERSALCRKPWRPAQLATAGRRGRRREQPEPCPAAPGRSPTGRSPCASPPAAAWAAQEAADNSWRIAIAAPPFRSASAIVCGCERAGGVGERCAGPAVRIVGLEAPTRETWQKRLSGRAGERAATPGARSVCTPKCGRELMWWR